jgi:hypothetical protein
MNEQDWLSCTDPTPLLRFLEEAQIGERKARLLACACCRQIWPLLPDPRSRQAVVVAERYADGQATPIELGQARNHALKVADRAKNQAAWAPYWAANAKASGPLWNAFAAASGALARQAVQAARGNQARQTAAWDAAQLEGFRDQVALLREVIGNPFRPPVVEPAWLRWNGGIVPRLAEEIYESRAFDHLPVLGDALEEAGCTDEELLGHCRRPGAHVRGCWLLDLLVEKDGPGDTASSAAPL